MGSTGKKINITKSFIIYIYFCKGNERGYRHVSSTFLQSDSSFWQSEAEEIGAQVEIVPFFVYSVPEIMNHYSEFCKYNKNKIFYIYVLSD
jgi:hypothetical protein